MTLLVADKKLQILCVNQDKFVFHPTKLSSYALSVIRNKKFNKLFLFLNQPRTTEDALNFISNELNVEKTIAADMINSLCQKGFVRECDDRYRNEAIWRDNHWHEALIFHLHTNSLPKMMYNNEWGEKTDVALMEEYVNDEEIPSSYKILTGKNIPLVKPDVDNKYKVSHLLKPVKQAVSLDFSMLSRLLYYAFGQIDTRYMRVTGAHIRKTIPSGGARHPIEAYFIMADIKDIAAGIYHYNVKEHALTLIKRLDREEAFSIIQKNILLDDNRPGFKYSMAVIYSCLFARSMFRYREARSYRVMSYDMGHITQNLSFLAKGYGLNVYSGYSCHEESMEKMIGLDNLMESIMAYSVM